MVAPLLAKAKIVKMRADLLFGLEDSYHLYYPSRYTWLVVFLVRRESLAIQ